MIWKDHPKLVGKHAFMGASKYHWVNYSEEKIAQAFKNSEAVARGTELHELAAKLIKNGVRLPKNRNSLNMHVNDAIGFKMDTEVLLYYSDNCFGTADAISFRKNLLRIHDYKSGTNPANMTQLRIYAALFCHEYRKNPADIDIILRIYQNGSIVEEVPEPDDIQFIMDKIALFDKLIDKLKTEGMNYYA